MGKVTTVKEVTLGLMDAIENDDYGRFIAILESIDADGRKNVKEYYKLLLNIIDNYILESGKNE